MRLTRETASTLRDWLALAFTPVVTAISVGLISILTWGPWTAETQKQRLDYIGPIAVISIIIVALGGQWFQRVRLEKLSVSGPGGLGGEIETEADR
jgi:hypothetical protein